MGNGLDDNIIHNRNRLYYNQLVDSDKRKVIKPKVQKKKKKIDKSFGAQKVDFKNFAFAPEGYKSIAYTLYLLLIPYLIGAFFLYVVVANGRFKYFKMLNMSAYPVVWLIGYEITATIALCWIFIYYLRYDKDKV